MPFTLDSSGVDRNVPVAAMAAGAGTGPPAPVMSANADDYRGTLTFGTGTSPAAGNVATVTFSRVRDPNRLPVVQLTETTAAFAALQPAVVVSSTGFTVAVANAPAASQGNTVYGFGWTTVD